MSEEETQSVNEAVAQAPEAEKVQIGREDQSDQKRDDQAYNWAEANRRMKEISEENKELRNAINALQRPKTSEPEEDYGVKDEDLIEGRHFKDLKKEVKQLRSYIKEKEVSSVEDRLRMKFSDFDEVVSKENIETLKKLKPDVAASLAYNPDPYSQAVAVYEALSLMGIGKDDPARSDKDKVAKNTQKPVSVNSVTKNSAIGNAHIFENGLTPDLKKALLKEMRECARRA